MPTVQFVQESIDSAINRLRDPTNQNDKTTSNKASLERIAKLAQVVRNHIIQKGEDVVIDFESFYIDQCSLVNQSMSENYLRQDLGRVFT